MGEPELLRAWLEARIARAASDTFDIRSALTEIGLTMYLDMLEQARDCSPQGAAEQRVVVGNEQPVMRRLGQRFRPRI